MDNKYLNIAHYLDSTYLKTNKELGITKNENKKIVLKYINEAIQMNFACIMVRPEFVLYAKKVIDLAASKLKVGTVIDFPLGKGTTKEKILEADIAIQNGAFDLDFVCDYNSFKRGSFEKFDIDIIECTEKAIQNKKIIKWIIETGALSREEIRSISKRINKLVVSHFSRFSNNIFIKTSTGYYGSYGAKVKDIKIIRSSVDHLQIKASGGISTLDDCFRMIDAGATRIGTSRAGLIYQEAIIES